MIIFLNNDYDRKEAKKKQNYAAGQERVIEVFDPLKIMVIKLKRNIFLSQYHAQNQVLGHF